MRGGELVRAVSPRPFTVLCPAAYALADAGFDVWLASARGSKYGKKHAQLNPAGDASWDFSSVDGPLWVLLARV